MQNGEITLCRYILYKRKFLAFFYSDMDAAVKHFEMGTQYPIGANGRLSHVTSGVFIDGLIAFYFARKHREDETRWQNIGEAVIDLTKQWALNSDWNFSNKVCDHGFCTSFCHAIKCSPSASTLVCISTTPPTKLYLLQAEYYFWKKNEMKALGKYEQSIKAAHDHHFTHEEGLAFERAARFHLHYGRNGEALVCFTQAKKCYKKWGAQGLVSHIEQTILQVI